MFKLVDVSIIFDEDDDSIRTGENPDVVDTNERRTAKTETIRGDMVVMWISDCVKPTSCCQDSVCVVVVVLCYG